MNKSEELAAWYLRLNGFFIIPNYCVHPRKTEADVIGVRFPYYKEFTPDDKLPVNGAKLSVFFAEVARRSLKHNHPWKEPEIIKKVFTDLGFFATGNDDDVNEAVKDFGESGCHDGKEYYFSYVFIGNDDDHHKLDKKDWIPEKFQSPKVLWEQVIEFVYRRFTDNDKLKSDHEQWDEFGKCLYNLTHKPFPDFDILVRRMCGIRRVARHSD